MAITYNNTTAGAVSYNTTDLDKVTYNGVEVFTKVLKHKVYIDARSVMVSNSGNFITINGTKYTKAGLYTTTSDTFTVGTTNDSIYNKIYLNDTEVASGSGASYTMPSLPALNYTVRYTAQTGSGLLYYYYIYITVNPTNIMYIPNEGNSGRAYVSIREGYDTIEIYAANSYITNLSGTVDIHVGRSNTSVPTPKIYLNGIVVYEGTGIYTYTITGDCTVTFVRNPATGSPYYYDAYITT